MSNKDMTRFEIARINPGEFRESTLSSQLRKVMTRWMAFAVEYYEKWNEEPDCGYFFGGSYVYSIETSATAMTAAILACMGEYNEAIIGVSKEKMIHMAVSSIRYMCFTHHATPGGHRRVKGRIPEYGGDRWGHTEGNFFRSSQTGVSVSMLGLAAWLCWDRLDEDTRHMVGKVLEFYADEYSSTTPGTGTYNDTQCEENAWTSLGIAAAYYMFPKHPNSSTWRDGYINWSLNSVATFKDKLSFEVDKVSGEVRGGLKIMGKTYGVSSVTFHPDYTTENHGYVHPDYMAGGIVLRLSSAVFPLLRKEEPFSSLFYNFRELYEKSVKPWCAQDGNPVPAQGQDWYYHRHHNKLSNHAAMNLFFGDADAAMFERKCIDIMFRRQESTGNGRLIVRNGEELFVTPGRQTALDMEYGSIRTVSLVYMLHLMLGDGIDPEYPHVTKEKLSGNHIYPYGGVYIYRTRNTFASFTTRCSIMGLSQPESGLWDVTADFQSMTGLIREAGTDYDFAFNKSVNWKDIGTNAVKENINVYEKGFSILNEVPRANGAIHQMSSFSALPNGKCIFIEKSRAVRDVEVSAYDTGKIGVGNENHRFIPEHAKGYKDIYFNSSPTRFYGRYEGNDVVAEYRGLRHVNINDRMGYLLYGSNGVKYINRHKYPKWKGLEDTLVLNSSSPGTMSADDETDIFAMVTLPNTGISRMDKEYSDTDVTLSEKDLFIIRNHEDRVSVNFSDEACMVTEMIPMRMGKIRIFHGKTVVDEHEVSCSFRSEAFSSRVDNVMGMLRIKGHANLEISCFEGFITVRNTSDHDCEYTFTSIGVTKEVSHPAGETIELMVFGDS